MRDTVAAAAEPSLAVRLRVNWSLGHAALRNTESQYLQELYFATLFPLRSRLVFGLLRILAHIVC